jgi:hypothetical protein
MGNIEGASRPTLWTPPRPSQVEAKCWGSIGGGAGLILTSQWEVQSQESRLLSCSGGSLSVN